MGRWEPDARGRLTRAALELYADVGFDQTTVADIAARAGVTERTFFRYFSDKREVLFDGSTALQDAVVEALEAAGPPKTPIDAVVEAFAAASSVLQDRRDFARKRAAAVASNVGLQERELLKLAALGAAAAGTLRSLGVGEPTASLAADAGVTVFRIGFERWINGPSPDLAQCLRATLQDLKALTS